MPGPPEQSAAAAIPNGQSSVRMSACSACPGDYEDPDRTAGEEFEDMPAEAAEAETERPEPKGPEAQAPQ